MAEHKINEPNSEVLDDGLQTLGLDEHPNREEIKSHLLAHSRAFFMHRSVEGNLPTIHQDANLMQKIAKDCAAIEGKINELHPLIHGALNTSYSEKSCRETSLKNLEDDLATLKTIAEKFGDAKFAKKTA